MPFPFPPFKFTLYFVSILKSLKSFWVTRKMMRIRRAFADNLPSASPLEPWSTVRRKALGQHAVSVSPPPKLKPHAILVYLKRPLPIPSMAERDVSSTTHHRVGSRYQAPMSSQLVEWSSRRSLGLNIRGRSTVKSRT